jgi:trk system potassium uptake protein TrkA
MSARCPIPSAVTSRRCIKFWTEFAIHDTSAVTDIPLAELKLKSNLLIGSINRKGKTWIPRGQDTIQVGDTVIIVTTQKGLGDILDILRK